MTKYEFHELSQIDPKKYRQLQWQEYKQNLNRHKNVAEKIVCVQLKRRETIKQILTRLLDRVRINGCYSRSEINDAISDAKGLVDERSWNKWWNYMWKAGLFTQTSPGTYRLELDKLVALELKCPIHLDKYQSKLRDFKNDRTV